MERAGPRRDCTPIQARSGTPASAEDDTTTADTVTPQSGSAPGARILGGKSGILPGRQGGPAGQHAQALAARLCASLMVQK